jgi:hypothetical protein
MCLPWLFLPSMVWTSSARWLGGSWLTLQSGGPGMGAVSHIMYDRQVAAPDAPANLPAGTLSALEGAGLVRCPGEAMSSRS